MDRISRIRSIIRWQELYQDRKAIVSTYESTEQQLSKLREDFEAAQINKVKLTELSVSLEEKIVQEEQRFDYILNQITSMENDRDNLKMSRQIKSWEKDMERYSQDREIVEAQLYYDKSKITDILQELQTIESNLQLYISEISKFEADIANIKAEKKDECELIESEISLIISKFDAHFVEYFNRLLFKNKGVVMAMIEDDSCSGCHILLPTSYHGGDLTQDAEDSALLQCPNCFRYLYYSEDL